MSLYSKRTFNLPDLKDRCPWWDGTSSSAGATGTGSLPKIYGEFTASRRNGIWSYGENPSGCLSTSHTQSWGLSGGGGNATEQRFIFNAANSSGSYNRTDNKVTPVYLKIRGWCIKYI